MVYQTTQVFQSKEENPTSIKSNQRNKQLLISDIPTTVGKYFMDNLQHPLNAVRRWTSNCSTPMIKDQYLSIKHQQHPPTFFSTVIHHTVFQAIYEISQILAIGLRDIWRCKAATISTQHRPTSRQRKAKKLITPSKTPPTSNIITRYFQPNKIIPVPPPADTTP